MSDPKKPPLHVLRLLAKALENKRRQEKRKPTIAKRIWLKKPDGRG
jgi:hypothetical protein